MLFIFFFFFAHPTPKIIGPRILSAIIFHQKSLKIETGQCCLRVFSSGKKDQNLSYFPADRKQVLNYKHLKSLNLCSPLSFNTKSWLMVCFKAHLQPNNSAVNPFYSIMHEDRTFTRAACSNCLTFNACGLSFIYNVTFRLWQTLSHVFPLRYCGLLKISEISHTVNPPFVSTSAVQMGFIFS